MLFLAPIIAFFSKGIFQAALEMAVYVAKQVLDFIVWYCKQFVTGIGAIFQNLSVLSVILVAIVGGGWFFKSWDNDKVLERCIKTCPTPVNPKQYYHPIKRKVYEKVSPSKLIYKKVEPRSPNAWRPFDGN